MRPYAILLLLCALSLNVVVAQGGASVCKAIADRVVEKNKNLLFYDEANMRLICTDGEHSPKAIEFQSERFKALRCGVEGHMWLDVDDHSNKHPMDSSAGKWNMEVLSVDNPPTVTCVEYCTIVGEGIVRIFEKYSSSKVFLPRVRAECSAGLQLFQNNRLISPPALSCRSDIGWSLTDNTKNDKEREIMRESFTPLQAECRKACHHGKRSEGVVSTTNEGRTVIKCDKPNTNDEKYGIRVNGGTIYSHLNCDENGYTDVMKKVIVADHYEAVNIECAVGNPCSYNAEDSSKIHFASATKTLACIEEANKLMAIELNSKRYESLKCDDFNGWMNGSNSVAEAFDKIEVKCVEYCAVEKIGNTIVDTLDSGERIISCNKNPQELAKNHKTATYDKKLLLLVNGAQMYIAFAYAACNLNHGWNKKIGISKRYFSISSDTSRAAKIECKRACDSITKKGDIVEESTEADYTKGAMFTCNKTGNGEQYGVSVNGSSIYPKIHCTTKGLQPSIARSESDVVVGSPFEPVTLDCALLPTTTTTTTTTTPAPTASMVPENVPTTTTPATSMDPERPIERDAEKPSKPTGDDDDHPRSTKSSILAISIYSIILVLVGYENP